MSQERVWCAPEQGCLLTCTVAWAVGSGHGHPTRALGSVDLAGDQALIGAQKSSLNMEGWGDGAQRWETGLVTWASRSLLTLHLSISLAPRPVLGAQDKVRQTWALPSGSSWPAGETMGAHLALGAINGGWPGSVSPAY